MIPFRNTKRSAYFALRAIGRDILSQWLAWTSARNDAQTLADETAAWKGGGCREVTGPDRPGVFLFGR